MFSVVKLATGYEVRCPYYKVRWTGMEALEFISRIESSIHGRSVAAVRSHLRALGALLEGEDDSSVRAASMTLGYKLGDEGFAEFTWTRREMEEVRDAFHKAMASSEPSA